MQDLAPKILHPRPLRDVHRDEVAFMIPEHQNDLEELTWNDILGVQSSWATLMIGPEPTLDNFASERPNDVNCRIVRGQHCRTSNELRREWGAALQFPWYCGENWNAFEECVNDLDWLRADKLVILVAQVEKVLVDEPQEFEMLLRILISAERTPGMPRTPTQAEGIETPNLVRFVFQSEDYDVVERFPTNVGIPLRKLVSMASA